MARVLDDAWESSRVVIVEGPRAVGKTTLVQQLRGVRHYVDLSVADTYDHAAASPRAWVESMMQGTVIDEAQRIPGLDAEVKRIVDLPTTGTGHLLLTGSVRMRRTDLGSGDPLVGRARRLRLLPFSQNEIEGSPRDAIHELVHGDPNTWVTRRTDQADALERVVRGGFPFLQNVRLGSERLNLIEDYVRGVFDPLVHTTGRDIPQIVRLYKWLAARSGAERNINDFSMNVELSRPTVEGYLDELQQVFLIEPLSAWHSSADRSSLERPRYHVVDPAFAAAFLGLSDSSSGFTPQHGPVLEAFVVCELRRLLGWSEVRGELFHWRKDRKKVDILIEDPASNTIVAIEVKAARETRESFFDGIEAFRRAHPNRNVRGLVLHCGDDVLPRGSGNWSVPFSALWTLGRPVGNGASTTSLAEALRSARTAISGQGAFVAADEKQTWSDRLDSFIEGSVTPLLREVGDLLAESGFVIFVRPGNRPAIGTAVVPRGTTEIEHRICNLSISDDGQPPASIGWQLEVSASLNGTGAATWTVSYWFGSERETLGSPMTLRWSDDPSSGISERLVRFAELLPGLVRRWTIERNPA